MNLQVQSFLALFVFLEIEELEAAKNRIIVDKILSLAYFSPDNNPSQLACCANPLE